MLGDALNAAKTWIREHAEAIEFVADIMSTIATVTGLLSFIPGMAGAAVLASLGAMALEGALLAAGAKNASWTSFALAGVGAIAGAGALRAGKKIVKVYANTERAGQLKNVRTVTGLVTGKTKPVARGAFSMAKSGQGMTTAEVGWRAVKMKAEYSSLAAKRGRGTRAGQHVPAVGSAYGTRSSSLAARPVISFIGRCADADGTQAEAVGAVAARAGPLLRGVLPSGSRGRGILQHQPDLTSQPGGACPPPH